MYLIEFKKQSKKFIQKLDNKNKKILLDIIFNLSKDPYFYPYKKLEGFDNLLRVRKGNFRISYKIYKEKLILEIIKIGNRENFYN